MAVGSVDRLEEIPDRVRFLFDFDAATAMSRDECNVLRDRGARVIAALAGRSTNDPGSRRLSLEANRVKAATGAEGRRSSTDPGCADRRGG